MPTTYGNTERAACAAIGDVPEAAAAAHIAAVVGAALEVLYTAVTDPYELTRPLGAADAATGRCVLHIADDLWNRAYNSDRLADAVTAAVGEDLVALAVERAELVAAEAIAAELAAETERGAL